MEERRAQLRQSLGPAMGYLNAIVEMGVLKTFIDYKAFDMIPDSGSISLSELARKIGGEHEVLERLAAHLIAADFLTSPAPDHVAHTAKSLTYKSEQMAAGFLVHVFNMLFQPMAQLPTYFAQHGLASPKHADVTPFGLAWGHPDKDVYGILEAEPALAKVFNSMVGRSGALYPMKGVYDFSWMQQQVGSLDGERPVFVDIGGSSGLALRDMLSDNPFVPAERCAVFDLPKAIENAASSLDPALQSIQLVPGSIFDPLPPAVRGSLVYQFRRILNDFPDGDVLRSWKTVREAAASDTRVYVVEELMQANRTTFQIAQDITFMLVGGKRRTVEMHAALAGAAGFRLNAQFQDTGNECAVLEFILA
ncbi:Isoflavone-7-O-methyltransferase 8 [Venustampulla echinocandica]|uniref:Isoflavone-7-O-methyltransferase 8 n=1 Tax=Venustampulla echinocandica TaxID=2656787 RepID=A0A370T9S5_9HELO|nr:Isoflavone-7-O-methyltransferase 8 [Venustampulla echinocandica]RDL30418.1 Isoflavone-7-O-methyltransferase 8 [Venustampulla echinocandica]